jgi:hypothetical protein
MPTQALGAPQPDMTRNSEYAPYPPGRRPGGGGPRRPGQQPNQRSKGADYALKGLGLLGIAVVSGLLWFLIRNDPATPHQNQAAQPPAVSGKYQFDPFHDKSTATDCASHATGHVADFLRQTPCTALSRWLYTTTLDSGQKVVTSVVVVRMDSSDTALSLQAVSDTDNSGHVKDLIEDHVATIPGGPTSLQAAGYESAVKGDDVIIVMTEYQDDSLDKNVTKQTDDLLKGVSTDAINQHLGTSSN